AWVTELQGYAGSEKPLEELSLGALSREVRRAALAGLTHASSFAAVALREDDPDVALEAFARVTRQSYLETLAKSAKTREVRAAARDALAVLAAAQAPDEATLNRAKLNLVVAAVEKAAAGAAEPAPGFDWD